VARLESLIESKQVALPPPPAPAAIPVAAPPKPAERAPEPVEEVTPEMVMVLTAAVAAFMGKRARIRGARLVRSVTSNAWAQQGRVFVQASHNLGVMHGR